MSPSARFQSFSLGLVIDDDWIAWGECTLPTEWLQQRRGVHPVPLLGERITPRLGGQRLDSFRRLVTLMNDAVTFPGDILRLPSVRAGIQQALLAAVSGATGKLAVDLVAAEYELTLVAEPQPATLILDVANDVATAERIAEMIALTPSGIGYRLVAGEAEQSIGPDAEFLQQFVRELVAYLPVVLPDSAYQPRLLLRLNGALGDLTTDPRQHIGKVLGHIVGLEQASQPLPLWVADPIRLDDLAQHAATLQRLRLFMHRRDMAVKVVSEFGIKSLEDLDLVLQSEACDAVLVEWGGWADLDQILQATAMCAQFETPTVLADSPLLTPAQLALLVDLCGRVERTSLLVTMADPSAVMPILAKSSAGRQFAGSTTSRS